MVEPGTNQKSPEAIDSNMVSEIEAQQLPPELPLRAGSVEGPRISQRIRQFNFLTERRARAIYKADWSLLQPDMDESRLHRI
jgi:hypothetical protein